MAFLIIRDMWQPGLKGLTLFAMFPYVCFIVSFAVWLLANWQGQPYSLLIVRLIDHAIRWGQPTTDAAKSNEALDF
jgi:hypothetical protein